MLHKLKALLMHGGSEVDCTLFMMGTSLVSSGVIIVHADEIGIVYRLKEDRGIRLAPWHTIHHISIN